VAVFESQEMKGILAGAINRLGEREKIVVTLYYYEGLTLAEIGQVLPPTAGSRVEIAIHNFVDDGPLTEPAA
jgi:DNA-directed RNA polymerase specialized sigma subunit